MPPLLLAAWIACQGFDGVSTVVAMRNPALQEGNPVLRGHVVALKVSINVAEFVAYCHYAHTHPTLVKTQAIGMAIAGCAAGTWNTHLILTSKGH